MKLRRQNVTFRMYPRRLIDENRWRASRYGIDGKMIDFGRKCEVDERELLHEMLEFIARKLTNSAPARKWRTSSGSCAKEQAQIGN